MKTRFKGHETFFFREGWLSKSLFEIHARNNKQLFSGNNGIVKLGVGANMVKSIKYWLITSGLMDFNTKSKTYNLTKLGEIIARNDVYLEDNFSLWLLHVNIVFNDSNATTWNLFFNHFKAESFNLIDVKNVLKNYVEQHEIKCSEKSLEADINTLLNMYTKNEQVLDAEENFSCPLNVLGLITKIRGKYFKSTPNIETVSELIILYTIIKLLKNKKFEDKHRYINITELETGVNSISNVFNFNRILINEYLEQLSSLGYIRVEKTAGLDMVYLLTDMSEDDVASLYFERRENV